MILLHTWGKEIQQRSNKVWIRKASVKKQKQMEVSPSTGKNKTGRQLQLGTGEGWQNTPIQECQGEAGYTLAYESGGGQE